MSKVWAVPVTLRPRAGLNPTRVRMSAALPADNSLELLAGQGRDGASLPEPNTALEYLQLRFPESVDRIAEKVALGEVYDETGAPISAATPFQERRDLYLFRDPPPDEPKVAALSEIEILHRDENLLVIDKPHLVSVMPRGRWVTQTALVYLRNMLDLPELSPVHRLDRPTAGVLVFTIRPQVRGLINCYSKTVR